MLSLSKRIPYLNRAQFEAALYRGLGRTHIFAQTHDLAPYRDVLLHACLYQHVYDRQSTGSRTDYLLPLVERSPDARWFRDQILAALSDPTDKEMDVDQLFDFAAHYSRQGDNEAHHLMYEQCAAFAANSDDTGAQQLIELDGAAGFMFVARQFDAVLARDPTFWNDDYLIKVLEERIGGEQAAAALLQALRTDPAVRRYLDSVDGVVQRRRERAEEKPGVIPGLPYAELQTLLMQDRLAAPTMRLRSWGEHASDADLERAAHDLLQQSDTRLLRAYLMIFQRRAFPLDHTLLLPLIWHDNARVRVHAINAVSVIKHPAVRELGFRLVHAHHHTGLALGIFAVNYQPGDETFFAEALAHARDDEEVHAVGFALDDIFTTHPTAAAEPVLLELYERTPCSLCRINVVQRLIDIARVPAWMIAECRHDAEERTQALAWSLASAEPSDL